MSDSYPLVELEKLVSIHDKRRKPITKSKRTPGIYPYYGASGIADYIDNYEFDGLYILLAEDGDNLRTRNTPIAFTAQGKFWVNNHAHVLQGVDELDSQYLCYALQYANIDSYISGSTRPKITQSDLKKIQVRAPAIPIRRGIAQFIKSFDEKINLNKQTNQTLEQMAQALFKSWFVDCDPVVDNALAAGNPIPDELAHRVEVRKKAHALADFQPLPEHIRNLFPSEFEQTGESTVGIYGWVPKGWEFGGLSSLAKFTTNRIDREVLSLDNYISTDNMLSNKSGVTKASKLPDLATAPAFKIGDILVSNIRPYFKKIWFSTYEGGRSNDVLGFEAINGQAKEYLLNLLYQDAFFDYMMTTSKGSKMPRGDKKAIMDWRVIIPPNGLQNFYSDFVKDYYRVIPIRNRLNNALSELRDTLLPKLISGEIRLNSLTDTNTNQEAELQGV